MSIAVSTKVGFRLDEETETVHVLQHEEEEASGTVVFLVEFEVDHANIASRLESRLPREGRF